MQDKIELAKVKAFYYAKLVELEGDTGKANALIQSRSDESCWSTHGRHGEIFFYPEMEYRIKPETVMHPGGEIPKPLTIEEFLLEPLSKVWIPSTSEAVGYAFSCSHDISVYVNMKLAHKTKEAAIAHAKVIYQIED